MYITSAAADSVTLLSIWLQENFNVSKIVGGIRLSQGKEIHCSPKIKGCGLGICILYGVCNVTAFCCTFKMFLVKPVFPRYFRKFLVTCCGEWLPKTF